ncbi:hypothetical protein AA313_de0202169 [Arthrobotrys entomopaga]|nr:hypothetical protein AA313_de0202169 [Arthrobotrys entomopaga]
MKPSTLFAAAALALDGVASFALPDLEVRRNNMVCKPIIVNVTRRTIRTVVNREIRTVCAPAPRKPYGRPQTTSELITTGGFGTCHYFVAKSGSHIISTVSGWCVDNPVVQTTSAPPTSITVTMPSSTEPTPEPTDASSSSTDSNSSSSSTCTSSKTSSTCTSSKSGGVSAQGVSTVVVTSMDPGNNGYCEKWVAMSNGSPVSTVSAMCVGGGDPLPAPTTINPSQITSAPSAASSADGISTVVVTSQDPANNGYCENWVAMSNGTPVSTVSGFCVGGSDPITPTTMTTTMPTTTQ